MVKRGELTDEAWARIAPLMPENRAAWRPVARPPPGGERHPVEAAYRGSLARPARTALRSLADLLRPLRALATRRHPGEAAGRCPNQERRGRRGRVAGQRGQHHRPGTPACRGCTLKAEQARRKKGLFHPEDEVLGRSRGGRSDNSLTLLLTLVWVEETAAADGQDCSDR